MIHDALFYASTVSKPLCPSGPYPGLLAGCMAHVNACAERVQPTKRCMCGWALHTLLHKDDGDSASRWG
jgi:hypothetical protein